MTETLAAQIEKFELKWEVSFYEPSNDEDVYCPYYGVSSFAVDPILEATINSDTVIIENHHIEKFYDKDFVTEFKNICERIKQIKGTKQ